MSETAGSGGLRWAEIIAVGSELLVPPRLDTNSLFITGRLNQVGIEVRAKVIVGDRREDVAAVLRGALDRVELVVMCGGLGPTDDDLTRDAVAALLGLELVEDPQVLDRIRQRFASRGARMPETNRRQALVPVGAAVLANCGLSGTDASSFCCPGRRANSSRCLRALRPSGSRRGPAAGSCAGRSSASAAGPSPRSRSW
jgi:molybdenum cofactor synthesis domain-containing protein